MYTSDVNISPRHVLGSIDPRIYGQYIENLTPADRPIYGGVCDDEGELRPEVIQALRQMGVPMIRWGGNYGDVYRWTDGIGPKDKRPRRPNYFWGGDESNRFGTHEFLALCAALSAQPYININMGSGGLLEALGWLEYCNYTGDTALTALRHENGQEKPWKVPIWGIGNEAWGPWEACYAPPELYVRDFNQYAQYMRQLDPDVQVVAVGHTDRDWNRAVLTGMPKMADYLAIHMYGHSHLERAENFEQLVALPVAFEHELRAIVEDLNDSAHSPIALILDEWNVRHFASGKLNRQSPRQVQDALFVAGVFNVLNRYSAHVKAANYVTMVNANAPLRAWDDEVTITPLYDVFRLYQTWMTGRAISAEVTSPGYTVTPFDAVSTPHAQANTLTTPLLDAAATLGTDNTTMAASLVNRAASQAVAVEIVIDDDRRYTVHDAVTLLGESPSARSARVEKLPSGVESIGPSRWRVALPPCSVTWITWQRDEFEITASSSSRTASSADR